MNRAATEGAQLARLFIGYARAEGLTYAALSELIGSTPQALNRAERHGRVTVDLVIGWIKRWNEHLQPSEPRVGVRWEPAGKWSITLDR